MAIPGPASIPTLSAELLKVMNDAYTQVVADEIDPDFIELYVKPQQMGADQGLIAYRAEVTARGVSVSVTDGAGGVYLLPLSPVPLSSESQLSAATLIQDLLAPHSDAQAIEESARTGGCELVLRFDTAPDRFSLIRRRPGNAPDILGALAVARTD